MEDRVDAAQRSANRRWITDVADDELDLAVEVVGTAAGVAVHLGREVVEHPDPVAVGEELVCEMGADEAGAAGNQDVF